MNRLLLALLLLCGGHTFAAESESMPQRTLRQIVERQKAVLAEAEKQGTNLDEDALQTQAQSIVHDYDRLLAGSPNFAAGYAAYGYFLGKVGMPKESIAMLLKANQLDPNIPLVKNQIGNYLAENGKPIEAAQYFLAAIKLAPNEPLYHFQLGTLLAEGRDSFLKSGEWTRAALDHSLQDAFRRASELEPDRFGYEYRYAMSFYDVETADWNEALKAWKGLEGKAQTSLERETMRLHEANVLVKLGREDQAKTLLESVTDPKLQAQKDRVVAQLGAAARK
jgi:tetratricopeptide (TPR) repeat protein